MNRTFLLPFFLLPFFALSQKKPLDHTVYDDWQSIGEKMISEDGKWVVYAITPQEGDAILYIEGTEATLFKKEIPRGYNAVITKDNQYVVFRIKPFYKEVREARIKKKKPEDFPKDSFGIVKLGSDAMWKWANIKAYKTPEKGSGWVAYHKEKEPQPVRGTTPTQKVVDSLRKTIDSLMLLVKEVKNVKAGNADGVTAEEETANSNSEASDLVLRRLDDGREYTFKNVADFYFSPFGQKLLLKTVRPSKEASAKYSVLVYTLQSGKVDTILKGGNDFRGFAWADDGSKAAFLAERDTAKSPQKFYQLYLYKSGEDSAHHVLDRSSTGMHLGMTVSEHGNLVFSKSGNRLFFGLAPIPSLKDTTLVDIDLVKLDIWHYQDDYLQSQQLFNLNNELKRTYLAVFDLAHNQVAALASKAFPAVMQTAKGDGTYFIATTDTGRRVAAQWSGPTKKDVYTIEVPSGNYKLVKRNHEGPVYPSSTGNYVLLYDTKARHYFIWNGKELKNLTLGLKVSLSDEEHDTPNDPSPYGVMGWHQNDSFVYIYDRFDVWKLDVKGSKAPVNITVTGRNNKDVFRYIKVDPEEEYLKWGQPLFFRLQNRITKKTGVYSSRLGYDLKWQPLIAKDSFSFGSILKAKDADVFIYTKENYAASPDIYVQGAMVRKLSAINPQQASYNWGTAQLFAWKTFSGKQSTGILYKPEDFDPAKKYPLLIYFYEKLSDGLYQYLAPSPTPSRLNIPFFVSRGYLVFAPDISYTRGGRGPGKDAFDYIVSGAKALASYKWVDSKNMAIQGQSWGGYQVAHLITRTNLFKAAWAGAPVVNMTSAYGGIRWESGVNRQFQYEKGQSRIGASIWERPDLYIENSPLFHLPKVSTPIVIMSNDADGAVPWYQGIEMFTALRRLGKKVWLLNYNGEAHNLVERKNRKDIQLRQQQYFDWLLKGEKPARWLSEGIPSIKKGKDWGLDE